MPRVKVAPAAVIENNRQIRKVVKVVIVSTNVERYNGVLVLRKRWMIKQEQLWLCREPCTLCPSIPQLRKEKSLKRMDIADSILVEMVDGKGDILAKIWPRLQYH